MRSTESHTIPAASASGARRSAASGQIINNDERWEMHSQIKRLE
jgi:hypothetical protein